MAMPAPLDLIASQQAGSLKYNTDLFNGLPDELLKCGARLLLDDRVQAVSMRIHGHHDGKSLTSITHIASGAPKSSLYTPSTLVTVWAIGELPTRAAGYDAVLLFTWQVHLNRLDYEDTWQVELVNNLRQTGVPLVIVAIKSPTDILEIPQVGTYLAMFGTTPGQEGALVDILLGRMQPQGQNPLPGLLP